MMLFITIGIVIYLIWKNETNREFMWYDGCMMFFVAIPFILIAVGFWVAMVQIMLI